MEKPFAAPPPVANCPLCARMPNLKAAFGACARDKTCEDFAAGICLPELERATMTCNPRDGGLPDAMDGGDGGDGGDG